MTDYPDFTTRNIPGAVQDTTPGYGTFWSKHDSLLVGSGATWEWIWTLVEDDCFYKVDTVYVMVPGGDSFTVDIYMDGMLVAKRYVVDSVEFRLFSNPLIEVGYDDVFEIHVTNHGAGDVTVDITLQGSRRCFQGTYDRVPFANFSAIPDNGVVPLTIAFTDLTSRFPLTWDWNFGDGTEHSTDQNPSHIYTAEGEYDVSLIVRNAVGENWVTKEDFITARVFEDLDTYTLVNPNSHLSHTSTRVTGAGVGKNEDTYLYSDKGADYFDPLNIEFTVCLTEAATNTDLIAFLCLANVVNDTHAFGTYDISIAGFKHATSGHILYLVIGASTAGNYYAISLATPYYCILKRALGGSTVSLEIYSDAAHTNLLDTLTGAVAGATKWRYIYAMNSYNNASAYYASGYCENIKIVPP